MTHNSSNDNASDAYKLWVFRKNMTWMLAYAARMNQTPEETMQEFAQFYATCKALAAEHNIGVQAAAELIFAPDGVNASGASKPTTTKVLAVQKD
ncbi:hypothetical protein H6F94_01145 [Leptolyngbya sp. FACHB-261]|nr:hypothetical protein [Leptolyngbya sp. FACHB-261]